MNTKRIIIAFLLLVYFTVDLLARAGGGQGYGGGGGGGGSGGGGSGDGGDLWVLIYLVVNYPIIGIPLLIIVILFFVFGGNKVNNYHQTTTISKYNTFAQRNALQHNLSELKLQDPQFNLGELTTRVEHCFITLQEAWSEANTGKIRPFVTDGIYESFNIILERYRQQNMYNKLENISASSCEAIDIDLSAHYHTITFKISAKIKDSMRDLQTDKILGDSSKDNYFTEYWTFLRKPGAKSLNRPGLMEGNCPNCANLLEIADKVSCSACGAFICSGEYDWLLSEISQHDWQPEGNKSIPGLNQLQTADPSFSRQALEDRAATTFWNIRRAEFINSTKYLGKFASPEITDNLNKSFKSTPGRYYADPAIGKVELLEINSDTQELDKAYIKISWAGHAETISDKRQIPEYHKSARLNDVYVFLRNKGVQSNSQHGFTSAHCNNCAAPASNQTQANCEYCGAPFNDLNREWILSEILSFGAYKAMRNNKVDYEITAISNSIYDKTKNIDKEQLMAIIINISLEDNHLDDEEREMLSEFCQHLGFGLEHFNQLIEGVHNNTYQVVLPQDKNGKRELLSQIINTCLIDAQISSCEKKILNRLAEKMGFTQLDVKLMIKQQQKMLYQEGKKNLKSKSV